MAKTALNTVFDHEPKPKRNGMDLTYRDVFSLPAGMLVPFMVNDLNPGDHVEFSVNDTIRALNMESFNFTRLKAHFSYYFVPYRLLWSLWPQFFTGVNDQHSSLFELQHTTSSVPATAPVIPASSLVINLSKLSSDAKDEMGYPLQVGAAVLFSHLQQSVDYILKRSSGVPRPGLGSAFDFTGWRTDWDDLLGSDGDPSSIPPLNLFRLLAYQKVYYDWFRNTSYEAYDSNACNIDFHYSGVTSDLGGSFDEDDLQKWLTPHYALWPLDYFTSLQPQINYVGDSDFLSSGIYSGGFFNGLPPYIVSNGLDVYARSSPDPSKSVDTLNLSSYRNAYALERMSMITQRAGKTYSRQMAAHWGENVNSRDDFRSFKIGETSHVVGVNQVVSNSETSEGVLGQLGSYLQGSSHQNRFKFDVHEHGVFMGIMYIAPYADYLTGFINPFNRKTYRGDYYQPEYDCLGMQPLQNTDVTGLISTSAQFQQKSLGWQNRYMEYKSAVDQVNELFAQTNPTWMTPRLTSDYSLDGQFTFDALRYFHVNPAVLDNIFLAKYDGTPLTFQFFVDLENSFQAIRNMSIDGTPLNVSHLKGK